MTAVSEDVILLDDTLTETFLTDLQSRGRTEETLKCYRNSLGKLCGFLPGRRLSHDAMRRWPEALREQGYCPSTINSAVSAANSLLGAARAMVAYANAAGGADNITVAVIPVHPAVVAPEVNARTADAWMTGPSASGSENGTPSSTRSAPASA